MTLLIRTVLVVCGLVTLILGLLRDKFPEIYTNPTLHAVHVIAGILLLIGVLLWAGPELFSTKRSKEPTREELKKLPPTDKEMLDFLEKAMLERQVSLTGVYQEPMVVPKREGDWRQKFVNVHLNGIGYVGRGQSFREAITDAMRNPNKHSA